MRFTIFVAACFLLLPIAAAFAVVERYPVSVQQVGSYKVFEFRPIQNQNYVCIMVPQIDAMDCIPAKKENPNVSKPQ